MLPLIKSNQMESQISFVHLIYCCLLRPNSTINFFPLRSILSRNTTLTSQYDSSSIHTGSFLTYTEIKNLANGSKTYILPCTNIIKQIRYYKYSFGRKKEISKSVEYHNIVTHSSWEYIRGMPSPSSYCRLRTLFSAYYTTDKEDQCEVKRNEDVRSVHFVRGRHEHRLNEGVRYVPYNITPIVT